MHVASSFAAGAEGAFHALLSTCFERGLSCAERVHTRQAPCAVVLPNSSLVSLECQLYP